MLSLAAAALASAASWLLVTAYFSPSAAARSSRSSATATSASATTSTEVVPVPRPSRVCAVGRSTSTTVLLGRPSSFPTPVSPTTRSRRLAVAETVTVSPSRTPASRAVATSRTTSSPPCGGVPGPQRVGGERGRGPAAEDGGPVGQHRGAADLQLPGPGGDRADPVDTGGGGD